MGNGFAKRLFRTAVVRPSYELWHRHRRPQAVRVLMYHRIDDQRSDDDMTVSVSRFAEQMRALADSPYHVAPLADACRWLRGRSDSPTGAQAGQGELQLPAVVITFDDGYADNYLNALPVLQRHGFPATVYVAAGFVDTDRRMPRYEGGGPGDRMMTWHEVRELARAGVEIGSHTVSHRELPSLSDEEIQRELSESRRMLEDRLGGAVSAFAYPRGAVNARVRQLAAEAGYASACTVRGGLNPQGADCFMLRRTGISGHDTTKDFCMKLSGAFDWIHGLISST